MAKLFTMYAGPATWGPKVQIQSVFGANVWCKFSVADKIPPGPIVFQYWSSDAKKWLSTIEGQVLKGQSVWLAAKSTGTGGQVTILVQGTAILSIGAKILLRVPVTRKTTNTIVGLRFSNGTVVKSIRDHSLLDIPSNGSPDQDTVREFTPVDQDGNPTGPSFNIDFGNPNATATIEMVDQDGNAVTEPFEIPDYVATEPDDSRDAPSDAPSDGDGGE